MNPKAITIGKADHHYQLYLTPKTPESGKAFANPTAMGTVG
jgi:hypothetical protein